MNRKHKLGQQNKKIVIYDNFLISIRSLNGSLGLGFASLACPIFPWELRDVIGLFGPD
jgi:hypothetical protein